MRSYTAAQDEIAPPALYDKWFVFALLAIVALGLLMMTSASIVVSDRQLHQPFYFLYKQLILMTIGVFIGGLIMQVDIEYWEKLGGYLLVAVMCMLALVLIPGV